jgi:hypothetical protein
MHEINDIGNPVDPELYRLEVHLCNLAARWRESIGNPDKQNEIVSEYHEIMARMYALGWDTVLPLDCELPIEYLPKRYLGL